MMSFILLPLNFLWIFYLQRRLGAAVTATRYCDLCVMVVGSPPVYHKCLCMYVGTMYVTCDQMFTDLIKHNYI